MFVVEKRKKKKKKDILQTRDNRRDMMTGMKGKLERAAETNGFMFPSER